MNYSVYLGLAIVGLWWWNSRTPPLVLGQKSLTLYYASWCAHCKNFMPEWNKLGCYYNDIVIRKVESSKGTSEYPVNSFPTLLYRNEAGQIKTYDGPRNSEEIKKWLDAK